MFHRGHGFEKDDFRAVAIFYFACTKGLAPSCDSVAEWTENGWGVARDLEKAAEFYRYACAIGSGHACARAAELGPRH
jgi:TPR repeat protein